MKPVEEIFKEKLLKETPLPENTLDIVKDSVFKDCPPFKKLAVKINKSDKTLLHTIENILIEIVKEEIGIIIENPDYLGEIKKLLSAIERVVFTIDNIKELEITHLKENMEIKDKEAREKEEDIILSFLKKLIGSPFQLTRYYKEVPVKCCSVLKQVMDKSATFKLENYRYFILAEGENVFINSPNLPSGIEGIVEKLILGKELAYISNFKLVTPPQENRKYLRVKPDNDIEVIIKKGKESYQAKLEDISIGGIGISFNKKTPLKIGDIIDISFFLLGKKIDTTGEIRNIKNTKKKQRIGIQFLNEKENEKFIAQYIIKREMEILNEVKI